MEPSTGTEKIDRQTVFLERFSAFDSRPCIIAHAATGGRQINGVIVCDARALAGAKSRDTRSQAFDGDETPAHESPETGL